MRPYRADCCGLCTLFQFAVHCSRGHVLDRPGLLHKQFLTHMPVHRHAPRNLSVF